MTGAQPVPREKAAAGRVATTVCLGPHRATVARCGPHRAPRPTPGPAPSPSRSHSWRQCSWWQW